MYTSFFKILLLHMLHSVILTLSHNNIIHCVNLDVTLTKLETVWLLSTADVSELTAVTRTGSVTDTSLTSTMSHATSAVAVATVAWQLLSHGVGRSELHEDDDDRVNRTSSTGIGKSCLLTNELITAFLLHTVTAKLRYNVLTGSDNITMVYRRYVICGFKFQLTKQKAKAETVQLVLLIFKSMKRLKQEQ